ncbi:carbamoyltransferase C-terminal domain-containing protein [Pseudomonas aeruginosa]|jgi:predicted NodU family carbamoyl transferase|nr:hypothetical protein [Pseudomonas aeruginosa]MDY7696217.1 carbamoyltransferase C-terminal domain-containing protein [Pseudomonas aeruginosa]HBN7908806.1 hypothetical protein [Pseudomonas aeruginosa]HBN7913239.1 hypothetical protein [Pseudomonas aeruginosa]HBN8527340.1 hypothetical protein [Pseudomonas aeruginosa]
MRIVGIKPGHDGAVALIEDGTLVYSIEGEKNSFERYMHMTPSSLLDAASATCAPPDCIAFGGWRHGSPAQGKHVGMGYWGVGDATFRLTGARFFGHSVRLFEASHESSHVWSTYGLSPFADRYPCHVLVWEGQIGRFYRLDAGGRVTAYPQVIEQPGCKYQFLYTLADPGRNEPRVQHRPPEDAGKIMALAAFGASRAPNPDEARLIEWVLDCPDIIGTVKSQLADSPFHDVGVESQAFKDLVRGVSDAIFRRYLDWARRHLEPGLPIAIGGGCGLNCEWNTNWLRSGLFSEVFVPPCVNDSGAAIGSAIQAQQVLTGSAAVTWNVYCGSIARPHEARAAALGCDATPLDPAQVAADLAAGHVVAAMHGRCEIGPRALGNRSLLADPRDARMVARLNEMKQRESYRPIAPVVTAEAAAEFFDMPCLDRYMLYFSRVRDARIPAVTHVDGSARVQVVARADNPLLWSILDRFGAQTGVPVLCNTSLNFKGRGFIDDVDDLLRYCAETGVRRAIVEGLYVRL